jgi:type IV pilus assembly protein PilC
LIFPAKYAKIEPIMVLDYLKKLAESLLGDGVKSSGAPKGELYDYEIRDLKGNTATGEIVALSLMEAIRKLQKKSTLIVSVKKAAPKLLSVHRKINTYDLMLIFRELSIMCQSGFRIHKALDVISSQGQDPVIKVVILGIKESLEQGLSFSEALKRFPDTFSKFHISVIRAAESGGFLENSLDYIASIMEREMMIRKRVQAALNYPIALFMVGMVGSFIVFFWIFPYIQLLVKDLNVRLPLYSQLLMTLAAAARNIYVIVPAFMILLFLLAKSNHFFRGTIEGRMWMERMLMLIPGIREVLKKSVLSHVLIILEALTKAGVHITSALELASETCNNFVIGNAILEVSSLVKKGKGIGEGMSAFPAIFPRAVITMVVVGEESGELADVFRRMAFIYDIELSATIESFTKLIEPIAVAALGVTAGVLILSFFVPIYTAINKI